ncbi:MAG: ATP synthase F1 subunit delta [Niameybacter sp.]
MAEIVVNRYATALFEIAKEQGAMTKFKEEASAICELLKGEPEYMNLLGHPSVVEAQKLELIEEAFSGRVSDEFVGLMGLIIKKSRTGYLIDILTQFINMAKEDAGLMQAHVTSAMPLTNQQIAQIKANLEQSRP